MVTSVFRYNLVKLQWKKQFLCAVHFFFVTS
jgi:hypothetical protein